MTQLKARILAAVGVSLGLMAMGQPVRAASGEATIVAPTPDQLEDFYPEQARASGSEGLVVVRCKILKNTRLGNCRAAYESPQGLGFAVAAVAAAEQYAYADLRSGGAIGDMVEFHIIWPTRPVAQH